jgi:hypothetical protein
MASANAVALTLVVVDLLGEATHGRGDRRTARRGRDGNHTGLRRRSVGRHDEMVRGEEVADGFVGDVAGNEVHELGDAGVGDAVLPRVDRFPELARDGELDRDAA